jgi:phage N-6-adenine-methyltransferase
MNENALKKGLLSSDKQDWATPDYFVRLVEKKLGQTFDLDVCAYDHTAKAPKWYTEEDDALTREWDAPLCWMNPPYGGALPVWLDYARNQAQKHGNTIVCLIPARTDTTWFHDIAIHGKIIFLRGRIKFEQNGATSGSPAFPSMLVIFGTAPGFTTWDWKMDMKWHI